MNTAKSYLGLLAAVALMGSLAACGGDDAEAEGVLPPTPWANRKPELSVASKSEMAVGDALDIIGKNFVTRAHGRVLLQFRGTYFDTKGVGHAVDYQTVAKVIEPLNTNVSTASVTENWAGKLTWQMWPNIVFHKNGDELGRFVGDVVVTNQGNDGSVKFSDPLPVAINVKPSLIPRAVQPMNAGCQAIISDTIESQPMSLMVEAVGLRAATTDNPITFYWTFMAEQWTVSFGYGTMDPSSVMPKTGAFMLEDQITSGRVSAVQDGGNKLFAVKVASDLLGSSRLKELQTGAIPSEGSSMPASVNVMAVDSAGKSASLTIPLVIHRQADLSYDGATTIAERYPPTMVTDCIYGDGIGRDVAYSESSGESKSRSLAFNWNVGASVGGNIHVVGINFSVGFGVNVQEQVSSDKHKSLSLSAHLLPGEYAACYRQWTKVYRIGQIIGYTACGEGLRMGEAILTDWIFTPDVATGPTCPPKTKLQPAQKFLD